MDLFKSSANKSDTFNLNTSTASFLKSDTLGFLPTTEESRFYGQIYGLLDIDKNGVISVQSAVQFLSKSRLPQDSLNEIWNLSDSEKRGYLNQTSLYRALKLISAAQSGRPISITSLGNSISYSLIMLIETETPLPVFEGMPTDAASRPLSAQTTGGAFLATIPVQSTGNSKISPMEMTESERDRFKAAFMTCKPIDGVVQGDIAREFFLKAQLSNDTLSRIWALIDTRAQGKLSLNEFTAGMYLITRIKSGLLSAPPSSLPEFFWKMINVNDGTDLSKSASVASNSSIIGDSGITSVPYVDKIQYEQYFDQLDITKKGVVGGQECVTIFKKSNLPDKELAAIWELSDKSKIGVLNKEQFVQAMFLIKIKMASTSNIAPKAPIQNNLGDLIDLAASSSLSPSYKNASSASLTSFSSSPTPLDIFSNRENQVVNRKSELLNIETQIRQISPSQDELIVKRNALDTELRSVTDMKHQATLKYTQIKANIEAETEIIQELQSSLQRERQIFETAKTELARSEKNLEELKIKSDHIKLELESLRSETIKVRQKLGIILENGVVLKEQLEIIKGQYDSELSQHNYLQSSLEKGQSEYQKARKDIQIAEHSLAYQRSRNEEAAKHNSVQLAMLNEEKEKLKFTTASLKELAKSNASLNTAFVFHKPENLERRNSNTSIVSKASLLSEVVLTSPTDLKRELKLLSPGEISSQIIASEIVSPVKERQEEFENTYPPIENLTFQPSISVLSPKSENNIPSEQNLAHANSVVEIDEEMKNLLGGNDIPVAAAESELKLFTSAPFDDSAFKFDSGLSNNQNIGHNSPFGQPSVPTSFDNNMSNTPPETGFDSFLSTTNPPFHSSFSTINQTFDGQFNNSPKKQEIKDIFSSGQKNDPFILRNDPFSFSTEIAQTKQSPSDVFRLNSGDPFAISNGSKIEVSEKVSFEEVFGKQATLQTDERNEVLELIAMGFDKSKVIDALDRNGYDVTKATDFLLK